MVVIAALLLHAVLLGGPAARALARAQWVVRAPQTALRLWHTHALGLAISVTAALLLTAHDLWEHTMMWLFHAERPLLDDAYGGAWHAEGIAEAALLTLLAWAATLSVLALRRSIHLRRTREEHRLAADTQGLPGDMDDPAVRVVRHGTPVAFCIPGPRGGARIVVTTAALEVLSDEELAATLEHERAHLRMRHHRSILTADVVTATLGWAGLLRAYSGQVRRLAEMAADDQAALLHGHRTVASALLEMCTTGETAGAAGTAAMTGPDPAERIRRLLSAPPATRAVRTFAAPLALGAGAVLLALPVAISLAPAAMLADTAHQSAPDRAWPERQWPDREWPHDG